MQNIKEDKLETDLSPSDKYMEDYAKLLKKYLEEDLSKEEYEILIEDINIDEDIRDMEADCKYNDLKDNEYLDPEDDNDDGD